jgi:hypothetical protein
LNHPQSTGNNKQTNSADDDANHAPINQISGATAATTATTTTATAEEGVLRQRGAEAESHGLINQKSDRSQRNLRASYHGTITVGAYKH